MSLLIPTAKNMFAAMSGSPLPTATSRDAFDKIAQLAFHETAGLGISGDNGVGKSQLIRHINRQAVASGEYSVILFDPAGDLADDCVSDNLDYSADVASRTHYFAPGDTTLPLPCINPLAVDPTHYKTEYQLAAALDCRANHTAALIPAVFGKEGWDDAPQMFTVTTAETRTLGRLGLPLRAVENFFDEHPAHESFIENLPFANVRRQFQGYLAMKPEERMRMTASSHNRLKALVFNSPILTAMLSAVEGCWSTRRVLDNREYHYFNLAPYGNLDDFQRKLILQFYMADVLFTVLSTPAHLRKPLMVVGDEAPVICAGMENLLLNVIPQTRKMLLRWVWAWQGVYRWQDAEENRLLRTITGQCNMAYFRHTDPRDARFAADQTTLGQKSGVRVKFAKYEEEQVLSHNELVTLVDTAVTQQWAEMGAEAEGGATHTDRQWTLSNGVAESEESGVSDGVTETEGSAHINSTQTGEAVADSSMVENGGGSLLRERVGGTKTNNKSDGASDQTNQSTAKQQTKSKSRGRSVKQDRGQGGSSGSASNWSVARNTQRAQTHNTTFKQQYLPVYEWRSVLRFLEFFSLDEERELSAGEFKKFQTGEFILDVAGHDPVRCRFDMLYNCLAGSEESLSEAWHRYLTWLSKQPTSHQPEALLAAIPQQQSQLLHDLAQLNLQRTRSLAASPLTVDTGAVNSAVTI